MVVLVPGVITNVNDIGTGIVTTQFPIHGGRANESRMTVDGLNVGNPPGGGQPPTYVADIGNAQEIAFTTSGGLGESETAGLVMNIVPKTGGNAVHGACLLQRVRREAPGRQRPRLADQRRVRLQWLRRRTDHEGSRLVLRRTGARRAARRIIPGVFYNHNAGDPDAWLYAPDTDTPAVHRSHVGEPERPRHLAGHAEEQGGWLLG